MRVGGPFPRVRRRPFRVSNAKATLSQIKENLRLVNDQIEDINVEFDHSENLLKLQVSISGEQGPVTLPFALLSDGTVKWVSLITAIYTHRFIFAIEEPENFIHPLMQQEILNIMRAAYTSASLNSFVLLTSHSETLLNAADPAEVILITMENGHTETSRPKDIQALRTEISRSGFGLGHFYISGLLSYV